MTATVPSEAPLEEHLFVDPVTGTQGWLVIDTLVDGLAFGGFRFHPSVTHAEVRELARCMTWKLACHDGPTGGAKAGLAIDPSAPTCTGVLERFARFMRDALLSKVMLGKDMGATDQLLDRMYATLGIPQMHLSRSRYPARPVPAKLRNLSGYCRHMTGRGVAVAAESAHQSLDGATIAIQGFGLVGAGSAFRIAARGGRVVALADAHGTVTADNLPMESLPLLGRETRTIDRTQLPTNARTGPPDDVLTAEVDILILAAGSHIVDSARAETINAQLVVEGANFALTNEGREVLHRRGIPVIPDVIASSSSAALVATQMASGNALEAESCWERIEAAISEATRRAVRRADASGMQVRQAYLKAVI